MKNAFAAAATKKKALLIKAMALYEGSREKKKKKKSIFRGESESRPPAGKLSLIASDQRGHMLQPIDPPCSKGGLARSRGARSQRITPR